MRRIQRRVGDSDLPQTSTSRSLTFDRKTFLECSKRMKGLVSTLGRQQNLKVEEQPTDDVNCAATSKTFTEVVQLDLEVDSEYETDQEQDNTDDAEPKSQSDVGGLRILNLPGPSKCNEPFVDLTVRSATFPNNYASAGIPAKKRKGNRDPIWMIRFSHFVSFMSTIGGNVDIVSYPPS